MDSIYIVDCNLIDAVADSVIGVCEDIPAVIDVQANDTSGLGNVFVTTISQTPDSGTVIVLDGDSIQYTPNLNYIGPDTFFYSICDTFVSPDICDTNFVIVNVISINDTPVAVIDTFPICEDSTTVVDVQANDSDPDGNRLFTYIITPPDSGLASVLNGDSILYTPNTNFFGWDSLTYMVCDTSGLCDTAIVVIFVPAQNLAPNAVNDIASTSENTTVIIDVQSNDIDPNFDTLTTSILSGPNNGTAVVLNNDSIQYTPDSSFTGIDTIYYMVCDNGGLCDSAMVIITVTPALGIDQFQAADLKFQIYPNPAVDELNIVTTYPEQFIFNIYNVIGLQVKSVIINGTKKISAAELYTGMYIYQIADKNGVVLSRGKFNVVK